MSRRSCPSGPTRLAIGALGFFLCMFVLLAPAARATPASAKPSIARSAMGGFVKDKALARILGETLFRDTVDVMTDTSISPLPAAPATPGVPVSGKADPPRDNSAAGRVARTVLAHQSLDKYLWLIQQAYDDSLWRGGDRERIEQHFPLIWRTSIMLYESTLNASPHRVRVCTPAENGDGFDCRDEIERAKIVPIPAEAPLIGLLHQPTIG